jgi:hypothetical protein
MKDLNESVGRYRVTRGEMATTAVLGNYGFFRVPLSGTTVAVIIANDGEECGWEHVSVHVRYSDRHGKMHMRTPTWDEMCVIKRLFFEPEETVIQFHPPDSEYVNRHPHCLHLWRPENVLIPLPPIELV